MNLTRVGGAISSTGLLPDLIFSLFDITYCMYRIG